MSPPPPNLNTSGQIHSHRLFLPQSAAAVLFGALGARGAPVAIGGGACGCCLGLVSARELAGTTTAAEGGAGAEEDGAAVDLVAVSIEGPADATAAAAAEMISVARRAAEEAAGGRNSSAVIVSAEDAACGGKWTYCDETGARRGPFPWPQVLRWARRGFWQPGFPLRDVASGGILPSALAVAAMAFLFPAVEQASQAQAAQAQKQQLQQQQQQQQMMTHHQQHQQHQHLQQQQHQHHHEQPTAMATEAPPLAVPAQPRPSPVIHHLFAAAAAPEEEMMAVAAGSSSAVASDAQRTQPQQQKQHPQQPGKSRMNIADALSILGRSGVGGGSGGGGGRRRGGGGGMQQSSTPLPPPPPPAAPVPAAAYAPAVAAYRPPAAAAAAAGAASGSGRQNATAAAAGGTSSSSADPRSLAAALDAAVVSSLAPAVALRLRAVHGDLWLDVLPEPLPWRTPETVLSVLKSTWKSSFAKGFGSPSAEARAAAAVEALPRSLRAARAGQGPAVSEAACALADLVRDFPGNGGKGSSEEAAAASAALARARAAAAAAASKAASAGWI